MPGGCAVDHVAVGVARSDGFGHFDAHVLDGVGVDLGADDPLHDIEQLRVGQGGEHGGAGPIRRVVLDVLLWQGEIEVLGVDLLGLDVNARDALAERELRVGFGERACFQQFVAEPIEYLAVLVDHRRDHRVGVEDLVDGEKAEGVEMVELFVGQGGHRADFSLRLRRQAVRSFWIAERVPSPRSSAPPTGQLTLAAITDADLTSVRKTHE